MGKSMSGRGGHRREVNMTVYFPRLPLSPLLMNSQSTAKEMIASLAKII